MDYTTVEGLKELLENWTFLFTFGYSLDVYGYGNLRVAINRKTGRKVLSYVV